MKDVKPEVSKSYVLPDCASRGKCARWKNMRKACVRLQAQVSMHFFRFEWWEG